MAILKDHSTPKQNNPTKIMKSRCVFLPKLMR